MTEPSPTVANFNKFLWMVKGTYPLILLIDFIKTKEMLIQTKENSNSRRDIAPSKASAGTPVPMASHSAEHSRKVKVEL
jgi:hypothetical protein